MAAGRFRDRANKLLITPIVSAAQLAENVVRFEVPVSGEAEWQALAKTGLVLTMVSASGASEVRMPLP